MADIVYCEWMKLKRSKIILIEFLGSFIVPFLVTVNDIRIFFSNPAATLSLWWIYEDTIMYLMMLFGPLVMAVVATYLISREYTEKTLKTVFTVPIGRRQFLAGKFIMLFMLVLLFMVLSWIDIVVISMVCSLFLDVSQITVWSAVSILLKMIKGGVLLFATLTPFVYLALRAKGTITPFIVLAAASLLNVVLSGSPIGGIYPWTAAYLLLTDRMGQSGYPAPLGMASISVVCVLGIGASGLRFQKEDILSN
ncbi:MAG: ABC transporter permease [Muribaculaceae bacterium]|nr:ABC transporter permease [Muribaculaceae bacterium]